MLNIMGGLKSLLMVFLFPGPYIYSFFKSLRFPPLYRPDL